MTYAGRVASTKTSGQVEHATDEPVADETRQETISPIAMEVVPSAASEEVHDDPSRYTRAPGARTRTGSQPARLTLREKYERKGKKLVECAAELEQARLACDAYKRELRVERDKSQRLAIQRDDLNIKLSESTNSLESERRLRADAEDLLAKRSAELDATTALLPTTESITDTRIVGLFRDLNYELAQSATTVAEAYEGITRRTRGPPGVQASLKSRLEACGALPLLKPSSKSTVDPTTALQIGLQAILIDFARTFLIDDVYQNAQGLKPILAALKNNEQELVASRWSSLAHQYARNTAEGQSQPQQLSRRLADALGEALMVAGYETGEGASASARGDLVLLKVEDTLLGVARLLLELDVILGEKVSVGWMESIVVPHGESFQKDSMDAAFQGDGPSKSEKVVCSTALGLRRTVKGESTILLKPMVALSSLLRSSTARPSARPSHRGRRGGRPSRG
ncbi:unnamed protein product [Peniophora sp. CBMAI 1063]|nr:unnamed protein product [Peniophora sp. CBMAI 1063]